MKHTLPLAAAAAALLSLASISQASTVTFNLGSVFSANAVAPNGPSPYLTAVIDDGGSSGSVTLTMTVASTVGGATVDEMYLNFNPSLDLSQLSFSYDGTSTGPAASGGGTNGIYTGTDAFQADGDGKYDILFDFPPPPGTQSARWQAGETVSYTITSTQAITASSFAFLSAPGGNAAGPFYAAAHFQQTGPTGGDSAWVGAVPVPAALWLFGSGLLALTGIARRKRAAAA
jgi:hypothetical protein